MTELTRLINHIQEMPVLLILGFTIIVGFYFGRNIKHLKLPSIIGFMLFGVLLGPSFLNLVSDQLQEKLSFITNIALGFVALSIGLELKLSSLKRFGPGIIIIIVLESLTAFAIVFGGIYFLTDNIPLALIFGAIAPASAPAGTVAIIKEYKAKGSLTKALYAVVGFDDGLGIIIFGFAAALAHGLLLKETGSDSGDFLTMLWKPLKEILLSIIIGIVISYLISVLLKKLNSSENRFVIIVGTIFITCGLCDILHLSLILTNMVIGMVIVNTQSNSLVKRTYELIPMLMPLLFILFFSLAGANLHIQALPSLGVLGIIYIFSRTTGLVSGSMLGGIIGRVEPKIRKYLGLGILSQAGVAIGLALIVKQDFSGLGRIVDKSNQMTNGDYIGTTVITTITATCIFFELIGPILTKIALKKAGEIKDSA